jgi:hypothetical protein
MNNKQTGSNKMKIVKIEHENIDGEKIIVHLEGYPHAQPVFDADISEEELNTKLEAWKITQDAIDSINNGTASPEIIEQYKPKPPFDAELVINRQSQVFPIDRIIALAPFTYTINEMIRHENWTKLKQMILGLIQGNMATQEDYEMLNGILKEQNIDLDNI